MNITLEMIMTSFHRKNSACFQTVFPAFINHEFPKPLQKVRNTPISGIHLLPKQTKNCVEGILYITDKYDFKKFQEISDTIPIICFSKSEGITADTADEQHVVLADIDMDFITIFNDLQECYREFVDWGKKLDFAVFGDASFQELLDIAETMLDALVLIYDPALKLLAYTKKYENLDNKLFQKVRKNGYMDMDMFKRFEEEHVFEALNESSNYLGYVDDFRDHEDNVRSININNELAVYCVLLYTSKQPPTYTNALYQVLCDTIHNLLSKQHLTFKKDRSVTDYLLMDLLDHPNTPAEQIRDRIYYSDLDYEGNYVVMTIHSDIQKKSSEKYFIQILRNNLINCRIFSYKGNIVILYHLPQSEQRKYKRQIRQRLQPILENTINNNLLVFASRPFSNIGQFGAAYAQAESIPAIFKTYTMEEILTPIKKVWNSDNLAEEKSGNGYYFYEDYSLSDLFFKNNAQAPIYNYCVPFLLELLEQDTKKSRQLLEILYEYLKNDRKLTVVAEKLDMHRNNVLYHVQQISENYDVDLDDYETRLKLLLSFELLRLVSKTDKTH